MQGPSHETASATAAASQSAKPESQGAALATEREARRLVESYGDLICRLSYTYLGSTHDAEDICQDVLLRALTKAPAFADGSHERAWIIRTTANACKDQLRSAARRTTVALDAAPEPEAPGQPDLAVSDAVSRLPEAQREAVHLYYYERLSIREIAEATGQTEAAITKRLSRARATLRHALG